MQRKTRIDTFGAVVLVLFSALLGLNQVMIKLVNAGMHPIFQAGLRSVCAFFPVLLFAIYMRRKLSLRDGSLLPGVIAGCLFACEFTLIFIGLDYTTVARASVIGCSLFNTGRATNTAPCDGFVHGLLRCGDCVSL